MSTAAVTANSPSTTHLDGIGDRPALAPNLEPVALAAVGLPAGTWGVVTWADDEPALYGDAHQNVISAKRAASSAAGLPGVGRVYLVRRCPVAVTVYALSYPDRGSMLGSLAIDDEGGHPTYADAWHHLMFSITGDPTHDDDHAHTLLEAWRQAHGLPASATALAVIIAVTDAHRDPLAYLNAYVRVLGGNLHADALAAHRADTQHVPAAEVDKHVREIAAALGKRHARTA